MALTIKNFELPDKQILENSYLKVQSVTSSNNDYEYLETVSKDEQKVSWISKIESKVTIFVWADELARKNRVPALHWFQFNLDYNLSEWSNIFEQAYYKLKEIYPEGEDC